MKRKSEVQQDWIERLEGKGQEGNMPFSMFDFEVSNLRTPNSRKKTGNIGETWRNKVLDGAGIQDFPKYGHTHTAEQHAILENNEELRIKHAQDSHFNGDSNNHRVSHGDVTE